MRIRFKNGRTIIPSVVHDNTYGGFVVFGKVLVYIALDVAGLACGQLSDDQNFEQILSTWGRFGRMVGLPRRSILGPLVDHWTKVGDKNGKVSYWQTQPRAPQTGFRSRVAGRLVSNDNELQPTNHRHGDRARFRCRPSFGSSRPIRKRESECCCTQRDKKCVSADDHHTAGRRNQCKSHDFSFRSANYAHRPNRSFFSAIR